MFVASIEGDVGDRSLDWPRSVPLVFRVRNMPFSDPWWWAFVLLFPVWIAVAWLNGDCSGDDSSQYCETIDYVGTVCEDPPPDRERPY